MARMLTAVALVLAGVSPALAQEVKIDAKATLAGSTIDGESALAPASDGFLADAGLAISREDVFDNGLVMTWRGEVRIQKDAESRRAFAGVIGNCSPTVAACPRVASGPGFLSPVSPATGLAAFGQPTDEDVFAAVERASLSLFGGWGEGIVGFDAGAATMLDARAPTVLERVSAFSSSLDPTGLVTTRARNDVTGSSAKVSYLSPRWLGFKAGVSYTPNADLRGVDFDPDFGGTGQARAELEDVWEGAISFGRQFADQGLRVRAALTMTSATSGSPLVGFGDYEAWGGGLELEKGPLTGGVRYLKSDNGWAAGNGDYEAFEVGLIWQGEKWRFGLEGGWSTDELNAVEGSSFLIGVSRKIGDHLKLGLAWTDSEVDLPVSLASTFGHQNARNDGVVLELTVGDW